jgi:hypothetical protein
MGKQRKRSIDAEIRSKRAFSEMRAKVGRYNLTREEVARVRAELHSNRKE